MVFGLNLVMNVQLYIVPRVLFGTQIKRSDQ